MLFDGSEQTRRMSYWKMFAGTCAADGEGYMLFKIIFRRSSFSM